jgi:S-DNA-T family DNA segregation ATPase FtsK/SpoIIIE
MIAGPARSGKSSLLLAIAESLRGRVPVWGACDRRSPLIDSPLLERVAVGANDLPELLAAARLHTGPLVIMIDDAERFEDDDDAIANLLESAPSELHIIAAGRSDDLRSMYGHWSKAIRKARSGVLLQPNADYDGDLLGASIPRRSPVAMTPGRGYACLPTGAALIQAASPTPQVQLGVVAS